VEVPLCVALGFYHRLADYQSSGSTMSEYAIRGDAERGGARAGTTTAPSRKFAAALWESQA
jgi:hypothetical protein